MKSDVRQLALDTLHNRSEDNTAVPDSCFIFNDAGDKLLACDASAIPVLEEVVREEIVPAMNKYREQHGVPDWSSVYREGSPFAGLTELLGAYWVICARSSPSRAIEFMSKMTRPVVNEAVSVLAVYFHPATSLAEVAIPAEYVEYINQLSESDIGEFSAVAAYVTERLGLKDSAAN